MPHFGTAVGDVAHCESHAPHMQRTTPVRADTYLVDVYLFEEVNDLVTVEVAEQCAQVVALLEYTLLVHHQQAGGFGRVPLQERAR